MSGSGGLTRNVESFLFGNAVVSYGGAPTGNTAAYFDGSTGTYINLGTSTPVNFNLNTSNIFCEAWIYLNTFDSPSNRIIFHEGTGGLNWSFQVNSGRPVIGSWGTVSGVLTPFTFNGSNATTLSTWAHVAWAYTTAGRPIVYLNGIPELGSPLANYIIGYDSVNNTLIGRNFSPFLNGYIRDLRVIKGGVVPTTTFTPQAAPWAYGSVPTYASGGTNVLGLAAQYMTQVQVNNSSYVKSATGGDTVQLINGYYVHTFTTVGASTFTPATSGLVDVLVVAGGGGGGSATTSIPGGGGGAGEVYFATNVSLSQGSYTINVGSGGAGSTSSIVRPANGNSSNIFLGASQVVSTNGGGGAGNGSQSSSSPQNIYQQPQNGGSGGGCGRYANVSVIQAISVTTSPGGFGNAGGWPNAQVNRGSGGGGAAAAGGVGINNSAIGLGGAGFSTSISGSLKTYGTGGNGGNYQIGGAGANGAANTGNGGAGADGAATPTSGGNGGSGIVIIRYPVSASLTGTPLFSQLSTAVTSSAVAAFSLRAVNGTTAKAIRVLRKSDNAQQDFWADRLGNLLTAPVTGITLQNWLAGSAANVLTWYDQSGAGRNATGTLTTLTKTSNVNLQWALNPTNGGLTVSGGAFLNGTNFTIACTTRRLGAKNNDGVYGYGANSSWVAQASVATSYGNNTRFGLVMPTTGSTAVVFNDSSYSAAFSSNANVVPSTYVAASEPVVYTAVTLTNASQQMYINGTANGLPISTLTQVTANASTSFTIGTINYYGNFLGEIGELFIFNSALGATDISTIYSSR